MYANWAMVKIQIINMNIVKPLSFTTTPNLEMDCITVPVRRSSGRYAGSITPITRHVNPTTAGATNVDGQPYALINTVPITGESIGPNIPSVVVMDRMRVLSEPSKQSFIRANAVTIAPAPPNACIILNTMKSQILSTKQHARLDDT